MYDRFFQIAYEVKNENGKLTYVTRTPTKEEAKEGWECIEKASKQGGCEAIRIQELYYRHGVGEKEFGIAKNTEKADYYLKLMKEHCGY